MKNFIKDVKDMVEEVKILSHLDHISIAEATAYYNLINPQEFYHLCCRDNGIIIFNLDKNKIEVLSIGEENLSDILKDYKENNPNFLFSCGLEKNLHNINDKIFDVVKLTSFINYVDVHSESDTERKLLASNLSLEEAFSFNKKKSFQIA